MRCAQFRTPKDSKKIHDIIVEKTSDFRTVSPNLTLPVLVLIRLPSLLSFSAGEICLLYLNLIQFDETLYYTVLTVLS